jgi:hypothetical protein
MSLRSICHKKHKASDGTARLLSGYSRAVAASASGLSFSCFSWPSPLCVLRVLCVKFLRPIEGGAS